MRLYYCFMFITCPLNRCSSHCFNIWNNEIVFLFEWRVGGVVIKRRGVKILLVQQVRTLSVPWMKTIYISFFKLYFKISLHYHSGYYWPLTIFNSFNFPHFPAIQFYFNGFTTRLWNMSELYCLPVSVFMNN